MKVHYLVAMTMALSVSTSVFAVDKSEQLFVEGNCNNCHTFDSRTIGPTLLEIAAKYKDDKESQAMLEKKVRQGGVGTWGVLPMPGTRPSFSDEDIKMVVTWILNQKAEPQAANKSKNKTEKKAK